MICHPMMLEQSVPLQKKLFVEMEQYSQVLRKKKTLAQLICASVFFTEKTQLTSSIHPNDFDGAWFLFLMNHKLPVLLPFSAQNSFQ